MGGIGRLHKSIWQKTSISGMLHRKHEKKRDKRKKEKRKARRAAADTTAADLLKTQTLLDEQNEELGTLRRRSLAGKINPVTGRELLN